MTDQTTPPPDPDGTAGEYRSGVLTVEIEDHIATVWLDRPEKLNAMNQAFWDDLPAIVRELSADDRARVVVIQGRGRAFSVGIDLAIFGELGAAAASNRSTASKNLDLYRTIAAMQETMTSLAAIQKPVIAAVHGYCLGGGIDLITSADIRLAAADATFSVRETKIGMVADVGTTQRLPRVISPGHAAELLYTGKDIGADRAKEIGLVNDVYPDADSLHKAARELALEIAANSPIAVQGIKSVLQGQEGRTVAEALDYMVLWNAAFLHSNDLVEGVTAQMERRPPEFSGE